MKYLSLEELDPGVFPISRSSSRALTKARAQILALGERPAGGERTQWLLNRLKSAAGGAGRRRLGAHVIDAERLPGVSLVGLVVLAFDCDLGRTRHEYPHGGRARRSVADGVCSCDRQEQGAQAAARDPFAADDHEDCERCEADSNER
jgi:hypothetical protein